MEKVSDFISKKYKNYQYLHHVLKRCCYIEFINKLFIKTMKVQKKKKKKKKKLCLKKKKKKKKKTSMLSFFFE